MGTSCVAYGDELINSGARPSTVVTVVNKIARNLIERLIATHAAISALSSVTEDAAGTATKMINSGAKRPPLQLFDAIDQQ